MSSYSSTSSFLSGSDFSTSPSSADGSHFPTSPEFSLAQTAIIEEEPLTHPLLHKSNLDVTVTDNLGFPVSDIFVSPLCLGLSDLTNDTLD